MSLILISLVLARASGRYLFDDKDCLTNPTDIHYNQHHKRCIEHIEIQIIGLAVCIASIFLKLPTLLSILQDRSNVMHINFRVIFSEALLNICQASFGMFHHAPFHRYGQNIFLLSLNCAIMLLCIVDPARRHDRIYFFIGLQLLLIIAICYFLEDVELFLLETSPYVTVASVLSFRLPQIYMMCVDKTAGRMSPWTTMLAMSMNVTRICGFLLETIRDVRPYVRSEQNSLHRLYHSDVIQQ